MSIVPVLNDDATESTASRRRLAWLKQPWIRIPESRRFAFGVFGVVESLLLVWWLAFFPGLGNFDSVQYSWEVLTSHWSTDHSVLYDVFVWVSFQLSGGIALLTAVQTTALAAVLAFAAHSLVQLGVRRRWAAAAAIAPAVLPSLGSFSIYVWKDVGFAAAEVWVMAWTMQLVASRRALGDRWAATRQVRRQLVWLFVAFAAVALLRNNGFVVVLVDGALLTALFTGGRRAVAATFTAALLVFIVVTYALFPHIGVTPAPADLVLGPAYHDVAVAYHDDPGSFTDQQVTLMKKVGTSKKLWDSAGADCWNADRLTLATRWLDRSAQRHSRQLFGMWRRTVQRHPLTVLRARLCRATIAWSPWRGSPHLGASVFPNLDMPTNMFGWWPTKLAEHPEIHRAFQPDPPVWGLRAAAESYVSTSAGVGGEWILWRGATWCYLAYLLVGVVAYRRRQWMWLGVAGVALANQLTVLADNPAQLIRYMEGCIYVGVLALPLLTLARREPAEAATTSAPADER